jgi:ATP-dependent Clp endopeptidase proteolytic subunit ClpP
MKQNWGRSKVTGKPDEEVDMSEKTGREIVVAEPKVLEVVENRIYFYSEIDRESVLTLNRHLRTKQNDALYRKQMEECECVTPIYLHIQSYGGSIFAGLAAMDQILQARKQVPVYTIVDGCAASAATFVTVVGTKRYINPNAFMLIHQLSSVMWGKYSEMEDEMQNMDRLMDKIREVYGKYTTIPMHKLDGILKHDLWINPKECLKYGLVDEVLKD